MKAFLMHRSRDFDLQKQRPSNAPALMQDLELNTLFNAMALGDKFLFEVASAAMLTGLDNDLDTIRYRQAILKDCLENPMIVREMYAIAVEAIEGERKVYWGVFRKYPSATLDRSVQVLQMFVGMLKRLKAIADEHAGQFESDGLTTFFTMLKRELDEAYFAEVQDHLKALKLQNGVLMSARLGKGNTGSNYILHRSQSKKTNWREWLFSSNHSAFTFYIADRDDSGFRALSELKDRGINLVANALAQSTDHILSFFTMLRVELAFYMGCLNLHEQLALKGEPTCFPLPAAPGVHVLSAHGMYDVCLSLILEQNCIGNDLRADDKDLVIITGANQGGKSTFLRSTGVSLMMMQCGMFVPAKAFSSSLCDGLFTHYRREEDISMNSGKLDEELSRMSDIVDCLTSDSIVLFNESFAATNEREGSEIARQIIRALLDKHIRVFFVTHLYEFARGFYDGRLQNAVYLRAERRDDGERTFRIIEDEPLQTSYGADLYERIFETDGQNLQ